MGIKGMPETSMLDVANIFTTIEKHHQQKFHPYKGENSAKARFIGTLFLSYHTGFLNNNSDINTRN